MKYIRTKDGVIFDTEYKFKWGVKPKLIIDENRLIVYDLMDKSHIANHGEVLKQADTIEELCDEYVAVGIPFRTFIVDLDELKKSGLDIHSFSRACYMQYKKCAIYGAVYTDKGLIYVAKMNDKGELELL